MKAITREILVHLLFVLLAQLVTNASLDSNSFRLVQNTRKFMVLNAVTNSYFEGKAYVMNGGVAQPLKDPEEREIKIAPDVRHNLLATKICDSLVE